MPTPEELLATVKNLKKTNDPLNKVEQFPNPSPGNTELLSKQITEKQVTDSKLDSPKPVETHVNQDKAILFILKNNGMDSQQQLNALAQLKELLGV